MFNRIKALNKVKSGKGFDIFCNKKVEHSHQPFGMIEAWKVGGYAKRVESSDGLY